MIRGVKGILAVTAIVGLVQVVSATGSKVPSGGPSDSGSNNNNMSKADMAKVSYNSGIENKDKANKLEEQAAKQNFKDAKEREKFDAKVKDAYTKSLKDFQKAAQLDPTLFQAYNGMGYTLRKTGEAAKALEMYDKALQMAPGFPDAIEYRGEAYLALGKIEDAKQSYLTLFSKDRAEADMLMKAMNAWVAAPPAGVDPATVSALSTWLKDRAKIASTTINMGLKNTASIWTKR